MMITGHVAGTVEHTVGI